MKTIQPPAFSLNRLLPVAFGLCVGVALGLCGSTARALSTLPFHEPFPDSYSEGTLLGAGATASIWDSGQGTGSGSAWISGAAALSYSGLATGGGRGLLQPQGGTARNRGASFTVQTLGGGNPTVYASFLLQPKTTPTSTRLIAYLRSDSSSGTPSAGVYMNTSRQLQVTRNSTSSFSSPTAPLDLDTTYFVVLRYKWNSGSGDDEVALWLNPIPGDPEPAPTISTTSGGSDVSQIASFFVAVPSTSTGSTNWLDEIRVGLSWAEVTPRAGCTSASILTPPTNQTAYVGQSATFHLVATGTTLTNQWELSTDGGSSWTAIAGATASSYTTPALTLSDNGNQYRVIVGAACDGLTVTSSPPAVLTVIDASIYSFRTVASGNWSDPSIWEQSSDGILWSPAAAGPFHGNSNITIRTGHTVTVNAPTSADDLLIEAGAQLNLAAAFTLNNGDAGLDCKVLGTMQVQSGGSISNPGGAALEFGNGGRFVWNSTATVAISLATWADGSTCEVQNGSTTTPTGLGQSFYDFYWNKPSSGAVNLGGQLTTVRNELRMRGSSDAASSVRFLAATGTNDLQVGGDFVVEAGYITISGGSAANTVWNLYLSGNFIVQSGGTFDSRTSGAGSSANVYFVNTNATRLLSLAGAIGHSGTGGGCPINWVVSSGAQVVLTNGSWTLGTANNGTRDSLTVAGTLGLGTNQITGPGALLLNPGAVLIGNGTNQIALGLHTIQYGGTLQLPGLPVLNAGTSFKLFDATNTYTGGFAAISPAIPGPGLVWVTSGLTVDGVLAVAAAVTGQPYFTSISLSGGNVTLTGANGPANGLFYLLSSSTLSSPLSAWNIVSTNNFDGSGNFSISVPVPPNASAQFYAIQVP